MTTKKGTTLPPFPTAENVYQAINNVMFLVKGFEKQRADAPYPVKLETAVISAVRDAMVDQGLILIGTDIIDQSRFERQIKTRGGPRNMDCYQATFIYKLVHAASGTEVILAAPGSGTHSDDKAPYIAKTGSKKYALSDVFLLMAWDEGADPDSYYYEDAEGSEQSEEERDDSNDPPGEDAINMFYALKSRAESLGIVVEDLSEDSTMGTLRERYGILLDQVEETEQK